MTEKPPVIEFPCRYPIKVIGESTEGFETFVREVMSSHAGPVADSDVRRRPSGNGRYISVEVTIVATGVAQLEAIHADLKASGRIKMVL